MADGIPTLVRFPGVQAWISVSYTLSHGIAPGSITLKIPAQATFVPEVGTLEIEYDGVLLRFRDCLLDSFSFELTDRGEIWTLTLLDRRWKWFFGSVSGHHNFTDEHGAIIPAYERDPQGLAQVCLEALGEQNYDVSAMPVFQRPRVEWERVNPAQALQDLAEECGCRVCLRADDTVGVFPLGVGAALPTNLAILSDSRSIDPANTPDALKLVGGKTRVQADIRLEAVGLDTDGRVRPIDDLSYTPAAGWGNANPPDFSAVAAGPGRELAKRTVYRWYRVKESDFFVRRWDDGILSLLGENILSRRQILPLENVQVETFLDPVDNVRKSLPATIFGVYWDGVRTFANVAVTNQTYLAWELDAERGIVQFTDEYVYALDDDFTLIAATLFIRCAVSVRDFITLEWRRHEVTFTRPGLPKGTAPRVEVRDDAFTLHVWPTYLNSGLNQQIVAGNSNLQFIADRISFILDGINAEYQTTQPRTITYRGIVPIGLDGAIQQVTWQAGQGPTMTTASRNTEHDVLRPSYAEARRLFLLRRQSLHDLHRLLAKRRAEEEARRRFNG